MLILLDLAHGHNTPGDGTKWMNATGWSCYTCKGQTESDRLADCLYKAAIKNFPDRRIRKDYSDGDPDWEENFYILRKTPCVAVLSENISWTTNLTLNICRAKPASRLSSIHT